MKAQHPDREGLLRLLAGQLDEEEQVQWGLFHLAHCPACLQWTAEELGVGSLNEVSELAGPGWGVELARERSRARRLLAPLVEFPFEWKRERLLQDEAFHSWGVAEALLVDCVELWASEPALAQHSAELALELLARVEKDAEHVVDLTVKAWGYLANSLRILSDLRGAERAFQVAERKQREGSGDERLRAELCSLKASLYRDQRRFEAAGNELAEALAISTRLGDRGAIADTLLKRASVLRIAGDLEGALTTVERALFAIDRRQAPRAYFMARATRLQLLFDTDRRPEARALLPEVRQLAAAFGGALDQLRLLWVEGQMALEEGECEHAEKILHEVRQSFIGRGIGYDAALANLDLAVLYVKQGRMDEVKQLAAQMLPIFESQDVHREALAALLLFRRAAEAELVTLHLLAEVKSFLEASRGRPELRFEAPDELS